MERLNLGESHAHPISPCDSFVLEQLDSPELRAVKGGLFEPYVTLVQGYVTILETPIGKRIPDQKEKLAAQAREMGLTGKDLKSAQNRAKHLYNNWLETKKDGSLFVNTGGEDPQVFLGDASHRYSSRDTLEDL